MVAGDVSGSSRRCAECKRKRKKCDLIEPACLRCIRSGVRCSGPSRPNVFVNHQQDSFPLETPSAALQRAYKTRSNVTDTAHNLYRLSSLRIGKTQAAWMQFQLRSSLPNDDALLSRRLTLLEPMYTSLLSEFQPGQAAYGGIFSADRAPTMEAKHYSSIAICIRQLLPWASLRIPILDPVIFSLLTLYYGRLHGNAELVEMARASYAIALNQYQRHLDPFLADKMHYPQSYQGLIGASIALHYYEHLDKMDVFDAGYQAHIDGALKLLEVVGPGLLQSSHSFRLVVSSLKPAATHLAIERRRPCFLSEARWREPPPAGQHQTPRDLLFDLGLGMLRHLNNADSLLSDLREGRLDAAEFVDAGLHLLLEFERLSIGLGDWLQDFTTRSKGPLYWPRNQPFVATTPVADAECAPKQQNVEHQLIFAYGTYAGLLVQYWALQLELLMTMIELREVIMANSGSLHVRRMVFEDLSQNKTTGKEIALLVFEAQIYLDSCLEGFLCMQLPLKTVTRYCARHNV